MDMSNMGNIEAVVNEISRDIEDAVLRQISHLISTGAILVERYPYHLVMSPSSTEVRLMQGIKLSLKDQNYIEVLKKELKEAQDTIKAYEAAIGAK